MARTIQRDSEAAHASTAPDRELVAIPCSSNQISLPSCIFPASRWRTGPCWYRHLHDTIE